MALEGFPVDSIKLREIADVREVDRRADYVPQAQAGALQALSDAAQRLARLCFNAAASSLRSAREVDKVAREEQEKCDQPNSSLISVLPMYVVPDIGSTYSKSRPEGVWVSFLVQLIPSAE